MIRTTKLALEALKEIEKALQHYADRFKKTRGSQLHANMGLRKVDELRSALLSKDKIPMCNDKEMLWLGGKMYDLTQIIKHTDSPSTKLAAEYDFEMMENIRNALYQPKTIGRE